MNKVKEKATSGEVAIEKQETTDIIAQDNQLVKPEADIDAYIELRQAFIKKVNAICVEGKDYHIIQGKKSLAKGGAEKIASIFKWTAKFEKDAESLEMLGNIVGLVAFKCTLVNSHFVGEGRGAASLQKNAGDPNKTLKMAQKSAFIDAVLRASGLSDFFTQDLEDMPTQQVSAPHAQNSAPQVSKQPSPKQAKLIKDLALQKKISQSELLEMAKGKNPSQLIEALFAYQTKQEELPVIQQEMSDDEKLAASITF